MGERARYDCIVVGQGLAGTMAAWMLYKAGKKFVVIDRGAEHSTSAVSSGIINPITGRRFVKSWMIEHLLPKAREVYVDMERDWGTTLISDYPIVRHLASIREENLWHSRKGQDGYPAFLSDWNESPKLLKNFVGSSSFGYVKGGCRIHAHRLITKAREWLADQGYLFEAEFDHSALRIEDHGVVYGDIFSQHIIFAEGWKVNENPYFNKLDFAPAKGEILICHIPGLNQDRIVKFRKFLVPIGDERFWVGSTYDWDFVDELPDHSRAEEIRRFLNQYLDLDYTEEDHLSGIRPATKYRRPFVGTHPSYSRVHILNGLGTKGYSIAPFWADRLIQSILQKGEFRPNSGFGLPDLAKEGIDI